MRDLKAIPALFDLSGKVACVTGASSGLGRRSALVLAAAGAKVVCVARRRDALLEVQAAMPKSCAIVNHDLADRSGLKSLSKKVAEPYGDPDIIVHAAGINNREPADEITPEGWDITLDLNLRVPFFFRSIWCLQCKPKDGAVLSILHPCKAIGPFQEDFRMVLQKAVLRK